MVSLIQSNYRGMGSGISVPGLGFMFQDRGQLFTLEPGHANVYAPGKRPFHTIIPGFVMHDNKPWLAFGVMGGGMQPQGQAQVLTNMVGLRPQRAGGRGRRALAARGQQRSHRLHAHRGRSRRKSRTRRASSIWKAACPTRSRASCARRATTSASTSAATAAIRRSRCRTTTAVRVYAGASESRKDGQAAGY